MKKALLILLILAAGCTNPLIIRHLPIEKKKIEMFGGTPERNFYYDFNLPDSLREVTTLKTYGSYANTSPVFYGNYIFIPDLSGRISSFNYLTGQEVGVEKSKGEIPIAPILLRTRIFLVVNNYNEETFSVEFYDYKVGEVISRQTLTGAVHNEMIKTDNGFLVVADNGTIYKFNFIGEIDWKLELKEEVRADPALQNSLLLVLTDKGYLVIVNVNQKKIIFKKKLSFSFRSGVTIKDSDAFFGDEAGNVFAFSLKEDRVLWKAQTGFPIRVLPVTDMRNIYVGNLNGDVYSISISSGEILWRKNFGGVINTTPALFKNVLVQPNLQNKVLFLNPQKGKLIKSLKFERSPQMTPVFFGNRLFLGVEKGKIHIYEGVQNAK